MVIVIILWYHCHVDHSKYHDCQRLQISIYKRKDHKKRKKVWSQESIEKLPAGARWRMATTLADGFSSAGSAWLLSRSTCTKVSSAETSSKQKHPMKFCTLLVNEFVQLYNVTGSEEKLSFCSFIYLVLLCCCSNFSDIKVFRHCRRGCSTLAP